MGQLLITNKSDWFSSHNLFTYISWLLALLFLLALDPEVNRQYFLSINSLANVYLNPILIVHVTDLGNGTVASAIILLAIARQPQYGLRVLILVVLLGLVSNFAKQYYDSPRPYLVLDLNLFKIHDFTVTTDSLPSGHTATIFSLAGLIWLSYCRTWLKYLALLIACVVALSRIAVGVHWPIDLAMGALIGWLLAFVAVKLTPTKQINPATILVGRIIIILLGIMVFCAEFVINLPVKEFPDTDSIYWLRKTLAASVGLMIIYQVVKISSLSANSKKYLKTKINYLSRKQHLIPVRFFKFGIVGASGFIIDSTIYLLTFSAGVPHLIARALSYWCSASTNWFFNRIFTFSDARRTAKTTQWLKYLSMALGSFLLNYGTYYILTETTVFFAHYKFIAFILGVAMGTLFNFSVANWIIFKPSAVSQQ